MGFQSNNEVMNKKIKHYDLWVFDTKMLFETLLGTIKHQFKRVPRLKKIKSWCFWLVVIKMNKNKTKKAYQK